MWEALELPTAMLTLPRICSGILLPFFSDWSREPPSFRPQGRETCRASTISPAELATSKQNCLVSIIVRLREDGRTLSAVCKAALKVNAVQIHRGP